MVFTKKNLYAQDKQFKEFNIAIKYFLKRDMFYSCSMRFSFNLYQFVKGSKVFMESNITVTSEKN